MDNASKANGVYDPKLIEADFRRRHEWAKPYAPGRLSLSAIHSDPDDKDKKPKIVTRNVDIGDVEGSVAFVMAYANAPNWNVYSPLCAFRADLPRDKRPEAKDCVGVFGLIADCDTDKSKNRPIPVAATFEINSSPGNYHKAFIFSHSPITLDGAKPLAKALRDAADADDATADPVHLWRIDGTLNYPNYAKVHERGRSREPYPVRINTGNFERLYILDALHLQLLDAAKPTNGAAPKNNRKAKNSQPRRDPGTNRDFDTLFDGLPAETQEKLATPLPVGKRSNATFSALCVMVLKGYSDVEIKRVVDEFPDGPFERYKDKKDLDGDIRRAREKARSREEDDLQKLNKANERWASGELDHLIKEIWPEEVDNAPGGGNAPPPEPTKPEPAAEADPEPAAEAPKKEPADDWPPINIEAITRGLLAAPPLTEDALPRGWSEWIHGASRDTGAPIGYITLTLLASAASAIGNTRTVVANASLIQPSVLWGALVGPPSTNKSPALSPFERVINRLEIKDEAIWKHAQRLATAQYEKELSSAKKGPKPKPASLSMPRWMFKDTTIERLAEILAENPRGMYLQLDELTGWLGSFGRYGRNDQADRAFYFAAYDAARHIRDREKNENKKPIIVPRTALSICGGITPTTLARLLDNEDRAGLFERFLFDWSDPLPVEPLTRATDPEARGRVDLLETTLTFLHRLKFEIDHAQHDTPRGVRLSEEAFALWDRARIVTLNKSRKEPGLLGTWLGKVPGRALRLALGFEYLSWAMESATLTLAGYDPYSEAEEISRDAMERALTYSQYSTETFRKIVIGSDPTKAIEDANEIIRLFIEQNIREFFLRDIRVYRGFWYFRAVSKEMKERRDNAMIYLADHKIIRVEEVQTKRGVVTKYLVNSNLFQK
jgi:hypothetical protein